MSDIHFYLRGHVGTIAELAHQLGLTEKTVRRYLREKRGEQEPPKSAKTYGNEGGVKKEIKRILEKYGAWYTMPYQAGYTKTGVPDFLICIRGLFLAIEAKHGRNTPTDLQWIQLRDIKGAGGEAWVVNDKNVSQLESLLLALVEDR